MRLVYKPGLWINKPAEGKHHKVDFDLNVFDESGVILSHCELLCGAIHDDIQTAEGSGATVLREIRRVESGEADLIEADGNAWVAHLTRDKVWFEGLYSRGTGGEVSLAQYKLAVQTYLRFLANPERKTIGVPFPDR